MGPSSERTTAAFDVSRRYVRVRGEKRGWIEFEFAIGDPEIAVELLLAPDDFRAFCLAQNAVLLDAAPPSSDH